MTTQKEMSKINKMVQIIQKEEIISKVQLVMRAGISISYYEKLKPFMEEIYPHKVRYEKETKTWKAIKSEIFSSKEYPSHDEAKHQTLEGDLHE